MKETWRDHGVRGFYRGIVASYYGISETVVHFVIYEKIKAKLRESKELRGDHDPSHCSFFEYMAAGACSKTTATCLAYPHGK